MMSEWKSKAGGVTLECGALAPLWLFSEHARPEETAAKAATGRRTPKREARP